jgi:hypothetical protein
MGNNSAKMTIWRAIDNLYKINRAGVRMKPAGWYSKARGAFRGVLDKDGIRNLKSKPGGKPANNAAAVFYCETVKPVPSSCLEPPD